MRRLAIAAGLLIGLFAIAPGVGEPPAIATRQLPPPTPTTAVAPPSIEYRTITDPDPPNVINVAHIPSGAAVEIKAVMAPPNDRGYMLALPSDIGKTMHALLVVNGDYHLYNGIPIGGVVTDGQSVRPTSPGHAQLSLDSQRHFSYDSKGNIPAGSAQLSTTSKRPASAHFGTQHLHRLAASANLSGMEPPGRCFLRYGRQKLEQPR